MIQNTFRCQPNEKTGYKILYPVFYRLIYALIYG